MKRHAYTSFLSHRYYGLEEICKIGPHSFSAHWTSLTRCRRQIFCTFIIHAECSGSTTGCCVIISIHKTVSIEIIFDHRKTNSASSHSEMRMDFGGASQVFFSNFTLYGRFWHSAETTGGGPAKPHVIDLYAAMGLRTAAIKIGPVFAVHAQVTPGEGTSFFKRDGNLFRVGALAEASLPLPARGSLTLNAAYEYGFVYNDEISIDPDSGIITSGDVVQRHPTTFRVSGQVSIPILAQLEFIGRFNFYKIATDMDPTISINPIIANRMFLLLFGVRYRYN